MSPRDEIDQVLSQLTLAEKVTLLSGIGACTTAGIERLDIPNLQVCLLFGTSTQTDAEIFLDF